METCIQYNERPTKQLPIVKGNDNPTNAIAQFKAKKV